MTVLSLPHKETLTGSFEEKKKATSSHKGTLQVSFPGSLPVQIVLQGILFVCGVQLFALILILRRKTTLLSGIRVQVLAGPSGLQQGGSFMLSRRGRGKGQYFLLTPPRSCPGDSSRGSLIGFIIEADASNL